MCATQLSFVWFLCARCISGTCSVRQGAVVCTFTDEENLTRQRGWSRSRTLSVSYAAGTTSPLEQRGSTTAIPEELTLDYAEITSIPPLPLWTLLAADKETPTKPPAEDQQVNSLILCLSKKYLSATNFSPFPKCISRVMTFTVFGCC